MQQLHQHQHRQCLFGQWQVEQLGYTAGGGIEQKLGRNFSVGLEYLYTDLNEDDYVVNVNPGTAPATNPFLLGNAGGSDMRRSSDNFRWHSIRATAAFRF